MAQAGSAGLPATLHQLGSPGARQAVALMLAVAAAVALLTGAWMWGTAPEYRVLFANVSDRDGGAIVAALSQMNLSYKLAEGGGAILVPASKVHEARLRLASQGLPKGSLVGFELMENAKLGTSQFQEQVNYQRALEGELARSIQSLAAVQSARVHLAIPKPSVFLRETQKPSASVLLNLYPGRSIEPGQASAVAHLVSSSVADLPIKNVTVVDQNGTLLSSGSSLPESGLDPSQLKYVKELERGFVRRIEAILEPMVGAANVRAQVTADVDFTQSEHAEELYRPNQTGDGAVRASQSNEAVTTQPGAGPAGVPGALSNQPPAPSATPITGPQPPAQNAQNGQASPISTQKGSSVSYEVDKTVRHTRQSVGTIKRLSVAVVVNHRKSLGAEGAAAFTPRSEAEMKQIQDLVKQALGYSEARGDSVTVANTPFTSEEAVQDEPVPFWQKPGTWSTVKEIGKHLLIALLVLFVFFKVLRPLIQSVLAPVGPYAQLPGGELQASADGEGLALPRGQPRFEHSLDAAKQMAKQEPKLVAGIVRNWVTGDER